MNNAVSFFFVKETTYINVSSLVAFGFNKYIKIVTGNGSEVLFFGIVKPFY